MIVSDDFLEENVLGFFNEVVFEFLGIYLREYDECESDFELDLWRLMLS